MNQHAITVYRAIIRYNVKPEKLDKNIRGEEDCNDHQQCVQE
jgi:hypothetical protein